MRGCEESACVEVSQMEKESWREV